MDKIFISSKTSTNAYVFPLFFPTTSDRLLGPQRRPNFSRRFLALLASELCVRQTTQEGIPEGLTPEDIFHYAYAVFHSPGYRSSLRGVSEDRFPAPAVDREPGSVPRAGPARRRTRRPAPSGIAQARQDPSPLTSARRIPRSKRSRGPTNTVWLDKAQTSGFKGVREDVWNFHIGGYQVCEKWLKDRKGRTLSKDDIAHYQKIVVALSETIRLMEEIDEVIEAPRRLADGFCSAEQLGARPGS